MHLCEQVSLYGENPFLIGEHDFTTWFETDNYSNAAAQEEGQQSHHERQRGGGCRRQGRAEVHAVQNQGAEAPHCARRCQEPGKGGANKGSRVRRPL